MLTGTIDNFGTVSVWMHGELDLDWATVNGGRIKNQNVIDVFNADTLENLTVFGGDMVVESGATLHIENTVAFDGVRVANQGSIIVDVTNPATLVVEDGTTIAGGQLTVNGAGTIDVEHGNNVVGSHGATLDGVTVTDNGALDVGDLNGNATLTLNDGASIGGVGTVTVKANSSLEVQRGWPRQSRREPGRDQGRRPRRDRRGHFCFRRGADAGPGHR